MKTQNPKNATSKPLVPVTGFTVDGCGFEAYLSGVIKIEGKRDGKRIMTYTNASGFADIMWNYLVEQRDGANEQ